MKKTGMVLFLALAAVFFMTAGQAAAQSQLNYSEIVTEGVFCEVVAGEIFCDVFETRDQAQLLGTLVLTKEMVDDIIAFPDDALITIEIFNDLLGVGTFVDISPINFPQATCFFNGNRTCVGNHDLGGTINMRATGRTLRFTYKNLADILFQLDAIPAPINATLDAIVEVETALFTPDPQCFNDMPARGRIALRNVIARNGTPFELLTANFRAQGRQGPCLDLIATQ